MPPAAPSIASARTSRLSLARRVASVTDLKSPSGVGESPAKAYATSLRSEAAIASAATTASTRSATVVVRPRREGAGSAASSGSNSSAPSAPDPETGDEGKGPMSCGKLSTTYSDIGATGVVPGRSGLVLGELAGRAIP